MTRFVSHLAFRKKPREEARSVVVACAGGPQQALEVSRSTAVPPNERRRGSAGLRWRGVWVPIGKPNRPTIATTRTDATDDEADRGTADAQASRGQ